MKPPLVISLGGSVIVPKSVDIQYLRRFAQFVRRLSRLRRVVMVIGGGATARAYFESAWKAGVRHTNALHWIGVRACQLNAELVRAVLQVTTPVLTDPSEVAKSRAQVLIVAPPQAGGTSDFRTVVVAKRVHVDTVYNVTNVDAVYTADPRRYRSARRLSKLTWPEYRKMFGSTIRPGAHFPFDPLAARAAAAAKLEVVVLSKDLQNLKKVLAGKPFCGTRIGPA